MEIEGRFNGPAGSANGGYTCGLVAAAYGANEVTLRTPPPLDTPLDVRDDGVYAGDTLVATAGQEEVAVEPPAFPGYDAARGAMERYAGLKDHPFPTCYVCGPRRDDGSACDRDRRTTASSPPRGRRARPATSSSGPPSTAPARGR